VNSILASGRPWPLFRDAPANHRRVERFGWHGSPEGALRVTEMDGIPLRHLDTHGIPTRYAVRRGSQNLNYEGVTCDKTPANLSRILHCETVVLYTCSSGIQMLNGNKRFNFKITYLLPVLLLSMSFVAHADSIFLQTNAATGGIFADTSRIQAAGVNDTVTLTLNAAPIVSNLYTFLLQPFGGTKTTSSTTLFDDATLIEDNSTPVFSGTFLFSQPLTESVTAGVATFAALQGSQISVPLSNGRFLIITPLADPNIATNNVVTADFQLSSTAAVPEPSSFLFVSAGLTVLAAIIGRRRSHS
jgi:hypothetical protein